MTELSQIRVTMTDVLAAGHCVPGVREWFRLYNLDFRDFVKNGIDAETFLATGDAYAKQVFDRKMSQG